MCVCNRERGRRATRVSILLLAVMFGVAATAVGQQAPETPRGAMKELQVVQPMRLPSLPGVLGMQGGSQSESAQSATGAAGTMSAGGNVAAYLRLEGISGPVTHQAYRGWVELIEFRDGILGASVQQGRFRPLTLIKPLDSSSVPLRRMAAGGNRLPRAEIAVVSSLHPQGLEIYRLVLDDVTIGRIETVFRGGGVIDEVDMTFLRVHWQFRLFNAAGQSAGTLSGCWDVAANRGC